MSRLDNVKKNITASYIAQFITMILGFVCRTIFIKNLGEIYLGINGLFANVIGLLSLAEMGFGTALNYEMYAPVAQKDYPKIKVLLSIYRRTYHLIAAFILVVGFLLIPFLHIIIDFPENVGNIYIYYIIYLLISITSYFSTYLFCLTNAEQKEYISTYSVLLTSLCTNILQIVSLLIFSSFIMYISISLAMTIMQQVLILIYFRKNYRHVFESDDIRLDIPTKVNIKKNVGGLLVGKFADVLVNQTDNIMIAMGLNLSIVGIADNYVIIISMLKSFVMALMKSAIPSLGNMAALEDKRYCYSIFKIYDLFDFIIYGTITVGLAANFQEFITIWAGKNKMIETSAMYMLVATFYIAGRAHAFNNLKTAFGIFYDAKITCIMRAVLNIVISVFGVKFWGLKGVYLGTIISLIYVNIRIPRLAYNKITGEQFDLYLINRLIQAGMIFLITVFVVWVNRLVEIGNLYISFIMHTITSVIITVLFIFLTYGKREEFDSLYQIIMNTLFRQKKNNR